MNIQGSLKYLDSFTVASPPSEHFEALGLGTVFRLEKNNSLDELLKLLRPEELVGLQVYISRRTSGFQAIGVVQVVDFQKDNPEGYSADCIVNTSTGAPHFLILAEKGEVSLKYDDAPIESVYFCKKIEE